MKDRRTFIKTSLIGGVSFLGIPGITARTFHNQKDLKELSYRLTRDVPTKFFDGKQCWVHPRAGIIPGVGEREVPRVVFTMSTLDLSGSDVFKATYGFFTDKLGKSWTKPRKIKPLQPRYEVVNGVECPVAASDLWPAHHKASKTLLAIGHTVVYTPDWVVKFPRPRQSVFSIYNPKRDKWSPWERLSLPDNEKFYHEGAGSVQRYDESDGSILLPTYYTPLNETSSRITVMKCTFDGKTLQFQDHGNELRVDDNTRGMHEPSLTKFNNEYFLTIRHDKCGFVTRSSDGLHFDPIKPWKFDDGSDLGNYNTQQNWVTHSDGLFLVYTRRGANNDHVKRHRAPLFMAQVDPGKLCVIRETERILVPERGARLGNFGVTDVSPDETWVTVAEWMQYSGRSNEKSPEQVAEHGSDGSVWVARIHWNEPNLYFNK